MRIIISDSYEVHVFGDVESRVRKAIFGAIEDPFFNPAREKISPDRSAAPFALLVPDGKKELVEMAAKAAGEPNPLLPKKKRRGRKPKIKDSDWRPYHGSEDEKITVPDLDEEDERKKHLPADDDDDDLDNDDD